MLRLTTVTSKNCIFIENLNHISLCNVKVLYLIDLSESHLDRQAYSENKTSLLQQLVQVFPFHKVLISHVFCIICGYLHFRLHHVSEGGIPWVIVLGYDGLPIQPVAPLSPDYIQGPEDPQTPPVPQDEDEREPMFIHTHDPDYVPEPIYPEYIPLEDEHEFLVEEQPLPPYEDDETKDGPIDYPMDGGDDGDDDNGDSSRDDANDEDEDEDEE
ncbi:hypothetical protein Tco_0781790, partial [Tanacetum coccineum]